MDQDAFCYHTGIRTLDDWLAIVAGHAAQLVSVGLWWSKELGASKGAGVWMHFIYISRRIKTIVCL